MPNKTTLSEKKNNASPDYIGLVQFLIQPFLDDPKSLSVDCEEISSKQKVWLRVAFDLNDKGKVFGRGGRNIQAVRTILNTAATAVGQSIYLDVYSDQDDKPNFNPLNRGQNRDRRPNNFKGKKPMGKTRFRRSQSG
ncbi:hypothetical protein Sta7437_1536 [Stanieria cyanosphaera PCC 7437]|uniref:RNA-binding protein (Contains KH domain) n=1 Tax=Stanieria cyanosphaera (strain ATCC 29371 / PCC 7437) TaxID=111780 RepID=K9XRG4_STAC7|nr:KH domain-containing protein [Stanieria cyanosphaera]AFZ35103.1 hypothetical protein Sta7437_1536 [Stanieria cyanosphaera PCC 7437]